MNAKQRRMCLEKKRYETHQAAAFFARTDNLRPYRCPQCGGWHLSSANVRRRRPIR